MKRQSITIPLPGQRIRWHQLKTDPEAFGHVWDGLKRAELRDLTDRDIRVGDSVLLEEFDRDTSRYSGRSVRTIITHIQRGYILPTLEKTGQDGAMLSFRVTRRYYGDDRITSEATLTAAMAGRCK